MDYPISSYSKLTNLLAMIQDPSIRQIRSTAFPKKRAAWQRSSTQFMLPAAPAEVRPNDSDRGLAGQLFVISDLTKVARLYRMSRNSK